MFIHMARPPIRYVPDREVNESLDRELRALLSRCFTRPQDRVFRERRYWKEPPAHRWIMRSAGGDLIAHIAAHDKTVAVFPVPRDESTDDDSPTEEFRVAGIAEVCVHPASRGMGHVRDILGVAHSELHDMGFEVAALFGNPHVYQSSGYLSADNLIRYYDDTDGSWKSARFDGRKNGAFLRRPLSRTDWPAGVIDIRGPKF